MISTIGSPASPTGLWMRAVSFTALRDLVALAATRDNGMRAKDMVELAQSEGGVRTTKGRVPSVTTLYHYRNTLLHLGILSRERQRYSLNLENDNVRSLVSALSPGSPFLSGRERDSFAEIVLANEDCWQCFFSLFAPTERKVNDLAAFIGHGEPVAWKTEAQDGARRIQLYSLRERSRERWLQSEDELQAVLYGVRYWARSELCFIDEVFFEDLGGVMFPVVTDGPVPDPSVAAALLQSINESQAWTTLDVRDLVLDWGPRLHLPLARIFGTIHHLQKAFTELVVFIPTSASFATVTATSPGAEAYQLRSYLKDESGRYISHIRVHRRLREGFQWRTVSRS